MLYIRKLGQNFLRDTYILQKIAQIIPISKTIVEVGGGDGALTKILMYKAQQVITLEVDNRLIHTLKIINPHTICADAMQYDFSIHKDAVFVSNLPYQIASPLLLNLFEKRIFKDYYVMIQKEVADKLNAPISKTNKISILTQYSRTVTKLFDVSPQSFYPSPKVLSSFVHIKELYQNISIEWKVLSTILHKAFSNRRKILSNSILPKSHVLSSYRPQDLSIEEWINIYHDYCE